ncbi:MAG: hypothetical protein INF91_03255 [Alphaproteobacteria bacterium]|nr:hypothetical protein [Alphaproteobacteria bacterium]
MARFYALFAALVMAILSVASSPAYALAYPTTVFNTVGGARPVIYCRDAIDGLTPQTSTNPPAYQRIDLENVGCISGTGPSSYDDPSPYTNTDGLYSNTGGGDPESKVEQSILLATGDLVDLTLLKEFGSSSEDDSLNPCAPPSCTNMTSSGIQVWIENSGRQVTWRMAQWLIDCINAGTLKINYLTIKASNSYALYKIPTGVFAGRYSTEGILTSGGSQPSISHIRFWNEVNYANVAEPGALGILALGALALGLRSRRRQRG